MHGYKYLLISTACSLIFSTQLHAAIAPDAASINVKQSCGTEDNCFEDMSVLSDWIHNTRLPSASAPLTVDIGPGSFSGYNCNNSGYTTLRGAGRSSTRLIQAGNKAAVVVTECEKLSFQDMTISGSGNTAIGIDWSGRGNSTYSNIELSAKGSFTSFAWGDHDINGNVCSASDEKSEHFFFGSTIKAEGGFYNNAYYTFCAVTWIYGSEIITIADNSGATGNVATNAGFRVQGDGVQIQVFGSRVTSRSGTGTITNTPTPGLGLVGATVSDGGTFHMHGGIIGVIADNPAINTPASGVTVYGSTSKVHIIDTAFNVKATGNAAAYRIWNYGGDSIVNTPFLWSAGSMPPVGNNNGDSVISETGQDMYVETDCLANGDCNSTGVETHIMVYNQNCSVDGAWFDTTTGRCRGDLGN